MKKILLIEDEPAIARVLKAYLQKEGFHVEQTAEGNEAVMLFEKAHPDLVLLDVMLPGRDGWSILKEIRRKSSTPVIMLTALGEVDSRLSGLNEGADDYITKPFAADEVVARVKAVLRRSRSIMEDNDIMFFGSLIINEKAHTVTLNGLEIAVTPRDLSLLLFLARHPNQTFTREQLLDRVWGLDYEGSDRAVDLAVKRLRQALHNWPVEEGEIKTVRGLGYQFSVSGK
ncbi:response regulator transcription factor [Bacillus marinisedimentorum]|uniref:response regulator transcription factor n=1 Tax=Bacillus marinisedimentorum TaxID=1821260 RepID=UPI0008730B8C|nr:response regulator transcription factor [Bacillus marinisedimentorum]